jgi:hypothetical protein
LANRLEESLRQAAIQPVATGVPEDEEDDDSETGGLP